ncbi:MAG: ABC transporter permease [Candidatus Lernaella stagnicola]|nr:ABC transporter permease [Candidatus Lernaella stagnicola]
MIRYIGRRLLLLIPTVLGLATLVFFFIHLIPGDPVEVMLGETAEAADKEALSESLGLNDPVLVQYGRFLAGLVRGDVGQSFFYQRPVTEVLLERLPATLELAALAMLVALLIAIPIGVIAAVKQYGAFDNLSMFVALVGVSMPNFWLGPLLIWMFSLKLEWFPVGGRGDWTSLVLPAITLGTALAAILSRMTRASVLEVLSEDFVRTARAKGLPPRTVLFKHVLRNALIPVITLVGLQLGALLSGAVITENVFSWPGVGTLFIEAIQSRDYPLVQGCVLFISFGYVLVNLAVDLVYAVVDPRIRLGTS